MGKHGKISLPRLPGRRRPAARHAKPEGTWYPTRDEWARLAAGKTVNGHTLTHAANATMGRPTPAQSAAALGGLRQARQGPPVRQQRAQGGARATLSNRGGAPSGQRLTRLSDRDSDRHNPPAGLSGLAAAYFR